jgi:hypothetical protein
MLKESLSKKVVDRVCETLCLVTEMFEKELSRKESVTEW